MNKSSSNPPYIATLDLCCVVLTSAKHEALSAWPEARSALLTNAEIFCAHL